ncbi:MAG: hypothetical protein WCT18_04990 [Patescibacteria group bacterium]
MNSLKEFLFENLFPEQPEEVKNALKTKATEEQIEEDFSFSVERDKSNVNQQNVLGLVEEYYSKKGWTKEPIVTWNSLVFEKDDKRIIAVATLMWTSLMVTITQANV